MTKWSFDEGHLGRVRTTGASLETRVIPRPAHVRNSEWYDAAAKISEILNTLEAGPKFCPTPRQEVDEKVCPKCSLRWEISEEKPECLRKI